MIATVRIAPMGHWCPEAVAAVQRLNLNPSAIVGKAVRILTHTKHDWNNRMASHYNERCCMGPYWDTETESGKEICALFNTPPQEGTRVICEHMLEMD